MWTLLKTPSIIFGLPVLFCLSLAIAGGEQASAAVETPLDRAARAVRVEVEFTGTPPDIAPEYLYAMSTMNYVQGRLSAANYSRLQRDRNLHAVLDAEKALELQAGLCNTHVDVFDKIIKKCQPQLKCRAVEFYLHEEQAGKNRTHIVAEVFYKGSWRLFDVTWGTVFLRPGAKSADDLLSWNEIHALVEAKKPWRELASTNVHNDGYRRYLYAKVDPLDHFAWADTDVLVEPIGTIQLRPDAAKSKYSFESIANNVGFVADVCGNMRDIRMQLDPRALGSGKPKTLEIAFAGAGNYGDGATFRINGGKRVLREVPLDEIKPASMIRVRLPEAVERVTFQVLSKKSRDYIVIKDVRIP